MAVRKGLNPQLPRNVLEEFARRGECGGGASGIRKNEETTKKQGPKAAACHRRFTFSSILRRLVSMRAAKAREVFDRYNTSDAASGRRVLQVCFSSVSTHPFPPTTRPR